MSEQGKFYTYGLYYPEDYSKQNKAGTMFYVGKGTGNRIQRTVYTSSHNKHKNSIILKIQKDGKKPVAMILSRWNTEEEAFMHERSLIFLMPQLCNLTDGGEGLSGYRYTPMRKAKHRRAMRLLRHKGKTLEVACKCNRCLAI